MKLSGGFAYLTSDELRAVDEEAIHGYGIDIFSLMENAGVGTAELARTMLGGRPAGKKVVILVGKGNNGGDGLVAARHLRNWDADVSVVLGAARGEFKDVAARQLATVERMGLPVAEGRADPAGAALILDALLGYSSKGDPRGLVADLIRQADASGVPILALDIPSGLDPSTGEPGNPCVVAAATLTLGFPKSGFLNPESRQFVGELYLCDISLPGEFYRRLGLSRGVFGEGRLVKVSPGL